MGACPIGKVWAAVPRLSWEWAEPSVFTRPGRAPLRLPEGEGSEWQHEVREALRQRTWKTAERGRQDMRGLDAGVGVLGGFWGSLASRVG